MKRNIIEKLSQLIARKKFQKIFEVLYKFSLFGMNIGGGGDPKNSGEIKVLKNIRRYFKSSNDLAIFDVGANVGDYSRLVKDIFENDATIYSFEPSLKTFKRLQNNIGNLKKTNLYNLGLGNKNEKIILHSDCNGSGLASIYKRRLDHFNIHMDISEEIEIKTLDDFCKENEINRIHLLKLDAEGNELKILEGAANMIETRSIEFIQFEFGSADIDSRTFFQDFYYLLKDKYNIYRVVKDGAYPISRYREMYEIFIPANYLAQKKQV